MAMIWKVTLLAIVLLHYGLTKKHVHVKYQWKTPEYVFPNEAVRQSMIKNGSYIPGNPFMLDVDVWNRGSRQEVFVTTPRFEPGTPATLSVLRNNMGHDASPRLEPYPSWGWNRQGDCNAMTSVLRVQVDACGRLWVIDNGVVDLMTGAKFICPPQVLVFDIVTSRLLRRYRIPRDNLEVGSLLITIAVDLRVRGTRCDDVFAYIADVTTHGLVVYDARRNKSWRVFSSLFNPYLPASHFSIAGESFDLTDGVFGLALGPVKAGDRTLFFHSLASFSECWVKTSVLRKQSLFVNNTDLGKEVFHQFPDTRPSQTAATAMDNHGVLFFSLLSHTSLSCWNSRLPYTSQNLVQLVKDEQTLQFVSGMKVVQDRHGNQVLWALSCRFQRLMTGSFNSSEVNFRVLTASVPQLVKGTSCDTSRT